MEKIKIREDNKKVYKLAYIILGIYAIVIAYLNIMNTQNLVLLYSLLASTGVFLFSFIYVAILSNFYKNAIIVVLFSIFRDTEKRRYGKDKN